MKKSNYLIFYSNTEPNYPEVLANSVQRELNYFNRFLIEAIKNMDVGRYAMEWEKDEDLTYSLYPIQVLEIKKPKNRLKLKLVDDETFSRKKAITDENGELIDYESFEVINDSVILILKESKIIPRGEKLYYGRQEIEWEYLASGFTGKFDYLEDRSGKRYYATNVEQKASSYMVYLKAGNSVKPDTDLFVNGMKIGYRILPINTIKGLRLFDNEGAVDFSVIKEFPEGFRFIIHSGRKLRGLRGRLKDDRKHTYNYHLDEKKKADGIWIKLKEVQEEQISVDSDQRTKTDIFFELLSASIDFVVCEQANTRKADEKIKIKRIDYEEGKLLLEREPKTKVIYPSKSTYQLMMQKNAIQTLMYRPSPEHRNLLRLFEPYDKTEWGSPTNEWNEESINWKFLTNIEREGDDEQRSFVLKALNSPDFAILEGPPGSGKTTAISELIYQLLAKKKRVLLSASTHVAVDNVLEKLEEKYRDSGGVMENGIVPLRIGREESLSSEVLKYQIENRKEHIKQVFEKEKWYNEANDDEKNRYLEEAVINSSNLICGTTIGILQYPRFKQKIYGVEGNKRTSSGNYVIPEFDYLIIDEASKTTFQEFLVPAIYAKKWVVVGDIRQLSPYTDTLHVRVNLDGVMENRSLERALVVFLKLIFGRSAVRIGDRWVDPPRFIYADSHSVIEQIGNILPDKLEREEKHLQATKLEKFKKYKFIFVTDKKIVSHHPQIEILDSEMLTLKKAALFDADVIFIEEDIFKHKYGSLPYTHILIHPNRKWPDIHDYRHLHWYMNGGKGTYAYSLPGHHSLNHPVEIQDEVLDSLSKDWAGELSWRMKRVHELALANSDSGGGSKKFYEVSMYALMPPKGFKEAWREIMKIGQVSLTSILSSIQEGVTKDWRDEENRTVMSHGFMDWTKEPRYEKLTYQHRMHPEISKIARTIFYQEEALRDDKFMKNDGRNWDYQRYPSRVTWIDVNHAKVVRNVNEKEARILIKELDVFTKWVKKQNKKFNVVILSFYEKQRKFIRDLLRERYPENSRKETRFVVNGIEVRNYTVDKVQGREGDVVFLSMVQNKRVGFMDSPNRLNVAITRAKYQLVIIGDYKYFMGQKHSSELREIANKSVLKTVEDR